MGLNIIWIIAVVLAVVILFSFLVVCIINAVQWFFNKLFEDFDKDNCDEYNNYDEYR